MAGIYVHIPFCKRKCIYCDFYSVASSSLLMEEYVFSLIREFDVRKGEIVGHDINTIYLGGGTPSLLPVGLLQRLARHIGVGKVEESTIEMNPDDVTADYAQEIASMGFNRVSIGVQSFDDGELRFLNRRHDADGAIKAVELLRQSGIDNISIDLIYGIPGQSLESLRKSINLALSLDVSHISAYGLTYEDGTRLTMMRDKGKITEVDDELCVDMFKALSESISMAGYEQYEISNFAKKGMYSKHNSSYWDFTPYLGLGASAHSFDGRTRRYNPSDLRCYMQLVEERGCAYQEEEESVNQLYNEWVMTRLRTKWGLNLNDLETRFGSYYKNVAVGVLGKYLDDGDVCIDNGTAILTKKGIMISDMIFRDLFIV